jgi:hypothetical protein
VTFGGGFTRTCPLTAGEWLRSTGLGILALPAGILMRAMPAPFQDDDGNGGIGNGGASDVQASALATPSSAAHAVSVAAAKVKRLPHARTLATARLFRRRRGESHTSSPSHCPARMSCISFAALFRRVCLVRRLRGQVAAQAGSKAQARKDAWGWATAFALAAAPAWALVAVALAVTNR